MAFFGVFKAFIRKFLIKALKTPKNAIFSPFLRTDDQNLVSENIFKGFQDIIWIKNMFKSIRGINRTDSGAIWTRICEDIVNFEKFPHPPLKKIPTFWKISSFFKFVEKITIKNEIFKNVKISSESIFINFRAINAIK